MSHEELTFAVLDYLMFSIYAKRNTRYVQARFEVFTAVKNSDCSVLGCDDV